MSLVTIIKIIHFKTHQDRNSSASCSAVLHAYRSRQYDYRSYTAINPASLHHTDARTSHNLPNSPAMLTECSQLSPSSLFSQWVNAVYITTNCTNCFSKFASFPFICVSFLCINLNDKDAGGQSSPVLLPPPIIDDQFLLSQSSPMNIHQNNIVIVFMPFG